MCDLFSMAGRVPAFGYPCKELERGGFMRKPFKFVWFLQDFPGGQLSKALQADPSLLTEALQPQPPGRCWTEKVMGAAASIFDRKT